MKASFPYGHEEKIVDIPEKNLLEVVESETRDKIEDEATEIRKKLSHPIGSPPLEELVKEEDKIAIIVEDHTRPTPKKIVLPPFIEALKDAGVRDENIKIVIAYGLHEPMDKETLIENYGEVVENYEVVHHDSRDTIHLGESSQGVPIEVNKEVINADFRVGFGLIEPHLLAGFTGGRKIIMPGVSSEKAVFKNHGYEMVADPHATMGKLNQNPIHKDCVEHAKVADLNFIVNVLLNKEKAITDVFAGDPFEAHLQGVNLAEKILFKEIDQKADIVITSNSGAPLDLNLYQTVKGIAHASIALKEGGILLIASKCGDGVGPSTFHKLHREASSLDQVRQTIKEEGPILAQWQTQVLLQAQRKHKVYLTSSLKENLVKEMMITPVKSLQEGLEKAFEELGSDAKVLAIPEGPALLPKVKEKE